LSSAERGVVTVIYGRCNPCSESPDVYPTPYFPPPQRARTGNPKPEKRLGKKRVGEKGRERGGGEKERTL